MVDSDSPSSVSSRHCPSCGTEMLFSGTQPAGLAQFFCEECHYRHDRFVGVGVESVGGEETPEHGS